MLARDPQHKSTTVNWKNTPTFSPINLYHILEKDEGGEEIKKLTPISSKHEKIVKN